MSEEPVKWKWTDPDNDKAPGVLLSDRILFYIKKAKLIEPFIENGLQYASYDLHVAKEYYIGERKMEADDKGEILIPENGLIYVTFIEKLNIPYYMVAQHDLKVRQVYRGFLAGRSLLIDPGFSGHINYPIFNFTNQPKRIKVMDRLTTVCFIKTTPFGSEKFWKLNQNVDSLEGLIGLTVKGIDDHECKKFFMDKDRTIPEYFFAGDTHDSSVEQLEKDVSDMKEMWQRYKTWAIAGAIAILVAVAGILLKHHYWTSDNIISVNKDITRVSSSINEMQKELNEFKKSYLNERRRENPTQPR